jgi:hypothetical protein
MASLAEAEILLEAAANPNYGRCGFASEGECAQRQLGKVSGAS